MNRRSGADGVCRFIFYSGLLLLLASCVSSPPAGLGVTEGRLAPCPPTPNCVCSEVPASDAYILPLAVVPFDQNGAWAAVREVVEGSGGTVEAATDTYLWATYRSRLFRFVDDLELRLEAEKGVVHVRSASRLGYSDFGVNRERVEMIRKRLVEQTSGHKEQ